MDLKSIIALQPELRLKWLTKACRLAVDGEVQSKHLYDIASSRKFVNGIQDKIGQKMMKTIHANLGLFSEKQQRFLSTDSDMARAFPIRDKSDKQVDEDEGEAPEEEDDPAARVEDMMARCRAFVREKASTYGERMQQVEKM